MKKVEAHRRLSVDQQQKRAPQLAKEVETYARKYLEVISKPGAANPGLLKNGAEALVEAAVAAQEAQYSYATFSELVARSRKVPVVPGLAALVDRLLEIPTVVKDDRVTLLSWRISTGSMRPERHLQYLSERAQLTADAADWKDYSWGVQQLVKKGTLALTDEAVLKALNELNANKQRLGDRAVPTQLILVDAHLARKEYREAERLMLQIAEDAPQIPESYIEAADKLLDCRAESHWNLHRAVFMPLLAAYGDGKLTWAALREKLVRARAHGEELARFLVTQELILRDAKLALFAAQQVSRQEGIVAIPLFEDLVANFQNARVAIPDDVGEIIAGRSVPEEPELPPLPATEEPEAEAPEAEVAGHEVEELEAAVVEDTAPEEPDAAAEQELAEAAAEELEPEFYTAPDEADAATEAMMAEADAEALVADTAIEEEAVATEVGQAPELAVAETAATEAVVEQEQAEELAADAELEPPEVETPEPAAAAETVVGNESEIVQDAGAAAQVESSSAMAELAETAAASGDVQLLRALLADEVAEQRLTAPQTTELAYQLVMAGAPPWVQLETRVWMAEWLAHSADYATAAELLQTLPEAEGQLAEEIAHRIQAAFGDAAPPPVRAQLARLKAEAGDYAAALDEALQLDPAYTQRAAALVDIEERIAAQHEPSPHLLMLQAKTQRALRNDPEAGFEHATTAALLAGEDPQIQADYQSWLEILPPSVVHQVGARQAVYICAHEQHSELLPLALSEIAAVADRVSEANNLELLDWLTQLRPALDALPDELQTEIRLHWTRLYLLLLVRSGQAHELPSVLHAASEQIEPEQALALFEELGDAVPVSARVRVECDVLLRRGDWEHAVDLALASAGISRGAEEPSSIMPIELFCRSLPESALAPTAERLQRLLRDSGDTPGELQLVQCLEQRCVQGNGGSESLDTARGLAENLLVELCQRQFEPALRYRLESAFSRGELSGAAADLLLLAKTGDVEAQAVLAATLDRLLPAGAPAAILAELAQAAAELEAGSAPEHAYEMLARTGLATNQSAWALEQAARLQLKPASPNGVWLQGQLALHSGAVEQAVDCIRQLLEADAQSEAQVLANLVLERYPANEQALLAMLRLEARAAMLDAPSMARQLLKLAQLYQERNLMLKEALAPLALELEPILDQRSSEADALQVELLLAALTGEQNAASAVLDLILERGAEDSAALLATFAQLAMDDADLPSSLAIAWGRALFKTGNTAEALDRLAGLRDAVGDYPEYITLLKEIELEGGGAGASMQLGEAYLHVNLWQQSAEEYAAALAQDSSLAEPILTQLRHHGALDPNPMKYPLHLLGLRAVAGSSRAADWGWALSALAWLAPRWSAEELYALAQQLWTNIGQVELSTEQQDDLLLALYRLADKLKHSEEALHYLGSAWELSGQAKPELLESLRGFDRKLLAADSPLQGKLLRWILEGCVRHANTECVIRAAQELAATGTAGRSEAIEILAQFETTATESTPVLLARLSLLDLSQPEGREQFVHDLLAAAASGLTSEQAHATIRIVLEQIAVREDRPELTRLLLLLLQQLGDEARAWQLALAYVEGVADPTPTALQVLTALADNEYNTAQRVTLAGIHQARGEYTAALEDLQRLDLAALGAQAELAEQLGEALLDTDAAVGAREWLIAYYRSVQQLERAADHLVWAHASGNLLPADWLHEQKSGELLFRSGQLMELADNSEAARRQYDRARLAEVKDPYLRAAIRMRLSQLAEQEGNLEQALRLATEAQQALPDCAAYGERVAALEYALRIKRIEELKTQPESAERTLAVARLHRSCGDPNAAISELQAGLNRGYSTPEVFIELAECFHQSRDFTIARRAFSEVLKRVSEDSAAIELRLRGLYGLAGTEEQLGDISEAIRCLEQIQMLRHDYLDSRERLKQLYASQSAQSQVMGTSKAAIINEIMSLLGAPKSGVEEPPGSDAEK